MNSNKVYRSISFKLIKLFISKTERFYRIKDKSLFPGPGAYRIDEGSVSKNHFSFSSQGYGVGFVSKEERFKNTNYENEKYLPGPGI